MDQAKRVWLSLEIAETQAIARRKLEALAGNEDVDELIESLGIAELAARRWHMGEAIAADLIDLPEIVEEDASHSEET